VIVAKVNPDNFPWVEGEEMVDYGIRKTEKMLKQHRAGRFQFGNLIVATSEAQLDEALRFEFPRTYAWYYKAVLL